MSTDKQSQSWYEERAEKYAAHIKDPKDSVYHSYYEKPAMYALLPDLKGKRVLSIGCGSGEDSAYLKNAGASESIGIDLSQGLIKIAAESHPDCTFHVMDMEKLEFEDRSFDFVYSSLAIHYVEDWTTVFSEVFRVLKPGSHFLFSCNHPVRFSMESADNETHWISKLEVTKDKSTKKVLIAGDYLAKRKIMDALGKNTVNTWHRLMGDIAESAARAGFLIERLIEPRPLDGLLEIKPESHHRLSKIPEFVIFKLLKP